MTMRPRLCALLFVVSVFPGVLFAQAGSSELELCAEGNIGSAIGAGACFAAKLRAADAQLATVEASYASTVVAKAVDPSAARRLIDAEAKAWREYRASKCALYGETEGGSEGWKSAMAASCALQESTARLASLRQWLARK